MTDDTNDELVEVSVPRRHLIAVYGLLAQLEGARNDSLAATEQTVDDQPAGDTSGVPHSGVTHGGRARRC